MLFHRLTNLYLAQSSPTETELLKQQMEFLQKANEQLTNSFNSFVGAINLAFVVIGVVLGILGVAASFFYLKTITEVKQSVGAIATQEVTKQISITIKEQVDYLQRVVEREKVIGWVSLEYFLPIGKGSLPPTEFNLLKSRGFEDADFHSHSLQVRKRSNIVVLDIASENFSDEEIIEKTEKILENLPPACVLVVYVNRQVRPLNELLKPKVYSIVANTPIRLMGTVVDAAYLADALRRQP